MPASLARRTAPWLLAAALAGTAGPAPAEEPPAPPPAAGEALGAPHLQGRATMRFLGLPIYEASLWVGPGFDAREPLSQPFVLELRYRRHLEGRAIAQRSIEEMRRFAPIDAAQANAWLQQMAASFPDVQDGDRLSGVHLPQQPVRFLWNDQPIARIGGARFARLFFSIWLAPGTSEPALRNRLLGLQGAAP
jgi:hypothetical protein